MENKRLIFAAGLIVFTILLIFLLLTSKTNQVNNNLLTFNPSGCFLPCVAGVIPGVTDLSEAGTVIRSQLHNVEPVNETEFWIPQNNIDGRLLLSIEGGDPRDGRYVHQVAITTMDKNSITTLGQLIDAGFTPVQVFRSRVNGPNTANLLLVLGDKGQILARIAPQNQVEATTPVLALFVLAPQNSNDLLSDIRLTQHYDFEVKWTGFGSIDKYFN